MLNIEKGVGYKNVFRDFGRDVSVKSAVNGLIATIFLATFLVFFWSVLPNYGLENSLMDRWMTSNLYVMAIGTILVASYFRKPIALAGSFASTLTALSLATTYSERELFAGALVSGVLLLILAFSGLMKKVLVLLPGPVVSGMIAGIFLNYGLFVVNPLNTEPVVVILMITAYLVTSKFSKRIPGVLASIVVAVVYYLIIGIDLPQTVVTARFTSFVAPAFTSNFPKIFISLTVPMTALVLGAENAQAYGVLETEDYDPPLSAMTMISGFGGIISALTGTINTNIAGPLTAITASPDSGKKEGRWTATVVLGILMLFMTPFYASFVNLLVQFPTAFVHLITGLTVLGVLLSAFQGAFKENRHRLSGGLAFLVAASGVKMLGLTAAFWALVIGDLIYYLYEGGKKKS